MSALAGESLVDPDAKKVDEPTGTLPASALEVLSKPPA